MSPDAWQLCVLADVVQREGGLQTGPFGAQLHAADYTTDGVPVVMPKDLDGGRIVTDTVARIPEELAETLARHRVVGGDILFGRRGDIGRCGLVATHEVGWLCGTGCLRARPDPSRVNPLFLVHQVTWSPSVQWLSDHAVGQTMLNLNTEILGRLPVRLPPLGEQRKIAAILSAVDDAIEATKAVIDQLQVVKKAMMAELLTRGLPGRHTRFKLTEIGEVPEAWEVVELGNVGQWLSGGTPSKQEPALWIGTVPWVSPKDMKRPRIDDAIDHVSEAALERGTQLAPVGSVLMVVRGMILAHTFPVAVTIGPVAFNQDIKALVPGHDFEPEFVLSWLQHRAREILSLTDVSNHGTKRLPSERLFDSKVPRPSLDEQRAIIDVFKALDERAETEEAWCEQLRSVKSALMSVLLTGEVRVKPDEDAA